MAEVHEPVMLESIAPEPQLNGEELPVDARETPSKYFFHSRSTIQAGDVVIVYQTRDSVSALTVTPGETFHTKYGKYAHSDFIGKPFGSRIISPPPFPGFVHLLRPTPSLWTLSLPHRTQILYGPDISFVMQQLKIRPGTRVVEAGTGSGSMSHALAMAIGCGKRSKLFTFEYHATRYEKAKLEFEEHGLEDVVQLRHRNVCKDGFGDEPSDVDAVFLDLPAPWEAVPHAVEIMRTDVSTRICCFSPCIEQVTRTVAALDQHGFADITMYEVLSRPHEIVTGPSLETVSSVSSRLRDQEIRKEQRRQFQIANARQRKVKEEATASGEAVEPASKRPRLDEAERRAIRAANPAARPAREERWSMQPFPALKPVNEIRGHTSYLTFATLYPKAIRDEMERLAEQPAPTVSANDAQQIVRETADLVGLNLDTRSVEDLARGSAPISKPTTDDATA